jgi:hypothetical protein
MRELEASLLRKYDDYKEFKEQVREKEEERKKLTSRISRISRKKRVEDRNERHTDEVVEAHLRSKVATILSRVPGKYPLETLKFTPMELPGTNPGFVFSFEHQIEEDSFRVVFWATNHVGILAQKKPEGDPPEIEIKSKNDVSIPVLHLPEDIQIPAGPLHFEEDSLPMSQAEIARERGKLTRSLKDIGYPTQTIEDIQKIYDDNDPKRKYPSRYFMWQPILPEKPAYIAVALQKIKPYQMSLGPDNPHVFNKTKIIAEEPS